MSIRKMMVLTSMVFAAAVLVAPVAQANPLWTAEGGFEVSGSITSVSSGVSTGPGTVDFKGSKFNSGGMAAGTISSAAITGTLATNLPECTATAASNASIAAPWPVTFTTPDTVDIGTASESVTFANHYSAGCAKYGFPTVVKMSGIVTGTYKEDPSGVCIDLNNYVDDMKVEGLAEGAVNLTNPAGKPICIVGKLE